MNLSRRSVLLSAASFAAFAATARAQTQGFSHDQVVQRAHDLAAQNYDAGPTVPDELAQLSFDAYDDIRFRADHALLGEDGGPFRLQLFHLGNDYKRPVTVNIVRDGIATPVPYNPSIFDFGKTVLPQPLPVDLGFAGLRIHYPLNTPTVLDELVAFLGATDFRFLGRGQRYGLSARGLAIGAGSNTEEFPFFREFWVEAPAADADRITLHALLDSPSVVGAYRFDIYPAAETAIDVGVTLFVRRDIPKLGLAPLSSMFFLGENDRRPVDDYRPELHDSDGLLLHNGGGEWLWRPLRNPQAISTSNFDNPQIIGFGLMQRDRNFDHYQDLNISYEVHPSYWIETRGGWANGRVELIEAPTQDENDDNIVASWAANRTVAAGETLNVGYRITATMGTTLHRGAKVVDTFRMSLAADQGNGPNVGPQRFIIDFAGGDLAYFLDAPQLVQLVPSISTGQITRTVIAPNRAIAGFRATIDITVSSSQIAYLRVFLRAGSHALSETWAFPWVGA